MTLAPLIEKLEAATGPSRELDAEIFRALGMPIPDRFADIKIDLEWDEEQSKFVCYAGPGQQFGFSPPEYTSSIDAATTLVPDGGVISSTRFSNGKAEAFVWKMARTQKQMLMAGFSAATEALARCRAALKAIEAEGK